VFCSVLGLSMLMKKICRRGRFVVSRRVLCIVWLAPFCAMTVCEKTWADN
jgi:hypothetical protein